MTHKRFGMRQYEAELGFMRDTSVQMSSKALRKTETPGQSISMRVSKRLRNFIVFEMIIYRILMVFKL